jgi:hypothetical protein
VCHSHSLQISIAAKSIVRWPGCAPQGAIWPMVDRQRELRI